MKYEEFLDKLKNAKNGSVTTGSFDLKAFSNKDRTEQTIRCIEKKCHYCNHQLSTEMKVEFYKTQHLTIFESSLLYYLFCRNKKPLDYAKYHNCVAGKRFIKNIKKVEVNV